MWSRRIEAATYRRRGRRVAIAADDCSDSASIDKRDFANGGAPRSSPPALAVLVVEEGDRPVKARTGARRGVACKGTGPVANDPVLGAVVRRLAVMRQGNAPRGVRDRLRGQPHAHAVARGPCGQRWRDPLRCAAATAQPISEPFPRCARVHSSPSGAKQVSIALKLVAARAQYPRTPFPPFAGARLTADEMHCFVEKDHCNAARRILDWMRALDRLTTYDPLDASPSSADARVDARRCRRVRVANAPHPRMRSAGMRQRRQRRRWRVRCVVTVNGVPR